MTYRNIISEGNGQDTELKLAWNLYKDDPENNLFPPSVLSHEHFNFTKHIHEDFDFFVKSVIESSLRLNEKSFIDFDGLYPKVLSPKINKFLYRLYFDNLFVGCSYGKELDLTKDSGECSLFQTTLTNNGICFSFNGQKPSDSFQNGKIVQSLEKITNETYPNVLFPGTGLHYGMIFLFCLTRFNVQ